jgi:hypothetical protein
MHCNIMTTLLSFSNTGLAARQYRAKALAGAIILASKSGGVCGAAAVRKMLVNVKEPSEEGSLTWHKCCAAGAA